VEKRLDKRWMGGGVDGPWTEGRLEREQRKGGRRWVRGRDGRAHLHRCDRGRTVGHSTNHTHRAPLSPSSLHQAGFWWEWPGLAPKGSSSSNDRTLRSHRPSALR
jgi:hypothetical protein